MPRRIVCAGVVCLDITPVFPPKTVESAGKLFVPGKLIEVETADLSSGGSVSNTGLACRFFGADVTLMGKIGDDYFGGLLRQILKKNGAQQDMAVSPGCATSYSVVLSPPGIDRIFLHYPGADDAFGYDDIDFTRVAQADLFHFGYPTIMRGMYENGGRELLRIFQKVKELGVPTSLDMTAVDADSDAAREDWRGILERVLPYVDFFVPSAEEICFLIDRPRYAEWLARADGRDMTLFLDAERDVKSLAETLLAWGAKVVLVKCGAPGMYLRTAGRDAFLGMEGFADWADADLFEKSFRPDRFCSGTGAGDVSIAALLVSALDGYGPARSLQLAAAAGSCCVGSTDALGGLVPFGEMLRRIAAGWEKVD